MGHKRVNISLPQDLADAASNSDLNVSEICRKAIADALAIDDVVTAINNNSRLSQRNKASLISMYQNLLLDTY